MKLKQYLTILVLLSYCIPTLGQSSVDAEIDSLRELLVHPIDSTEVMVYHKISARYEGTNLDSSITVARRGLNEARILNNDYVIARMLHRLAAAYYQKSSLDSATVLHEQSVDISKANGFSKIHADNLNGLSNIRSKEGKLRESVNLLLEALPIYESINETEMVPAVYSNLAVNFRKIKEPEQSVFYNKLALKMYEDEDNQLYAALVLSNLGAVLNDVQRYNESLEYSYKGRDYFNKLGYERYAAYPLTNMAISYDSLGRVHDAEKTYQLAIKLHTENREPYELAFLHNALANFYLKKDNPNKAIEIGKIALDYADESSAMEFESTTNKTMAKSYAQLKKYQRAHRHLLQHVILNDSISITEKAEAILDVNTKYETEKKEKEILIQRAELAEQNTVIQRRTTAVIGVGALALIFGLIGYLFYNQQRLKNRQLRKENELRTALSQVETQNRLQEQRLHISRDLHDNIGAQLTFIISSIDNLKYQVDSTNPKVVDKLTSINFYTRSTINQLRDTIWAMNMDSIKFEDLKGRMTNYISQASELLGAEIRFENNLEDDTAFSSLVGINIFRILQEGVNNAIKHAQANIISIGINENTQGYAMSIKDDGVGFLSDVESDGYGMSNMRDRAEEIHGSLDIRSSERGSEIFLHVPKI